MPTSQPTAPIHICNLALDIIGEKSIGSIETPSTAVEEIMARWYDHVRRGTLREYVWNFCQKYEELSRTGDGQGGYDDAYRMPNGLIRLNSVGSDRYDPIKEYDIFEREIHVDNSAGVLPIWYNTNVTEVSKMDDLFVSIFALRLALRVAYKITKKKSVEEKVEAALKIAEPKATSVDGQERISRRRQSSRYLSARKSGGSYGRDNRYYNIE